MKIIDRNEERKSGSGFLYLRRPVGGGCDRFLYFEKEELKAVLEGPSKLRLPDLKVLRTWTETDNGTNEIELYHPKRDLGESKNVATGNPEVVQRLLAIAEFAKVRRAERLGLGFVGLRMRRKKGWKRGL